MRRTASRPETVSAVEAEALGGGRREAVRVACREGGEERAGGPLRLGALGGRIAGPRRRGGGGAGPPARAGARQAPGPWRTRARRQGPRAAPRGAPPATPRAPRGAGRNRSSARELMLASWPWPARHGRCGATSPRPRSSSRATCSSRSTRTRGATSSSSRRVVGFSRRGGHLGRGGRGLLPRARRRGGGPRAGRRRGGRDRPPRARRVLRRGAGARRARAARRSRRAASVTLVVFPAPVIAAMAERFPKVRRSSRRCARRASGTRRSRPPS